jgi:hypothetical protein
VRPPLFGRRSYLIPEGDRWVWPAAVRPVAEIARHDGVARPMFSRCGARFRQSRPPPCPGLHGECVYVGVGARKSGVLARRAATRGLRMRMLRTRRLGTVTARRTVPFALEGSRLIRPFLTVVSGKGTQGSGLP